MKTLTIDIGNSSCHAALFEGKKRLEGIVWKAGEAPVGGPDLGTGVMPSIVAVSSVNAEAEVPVMKWLSGAGIGCLRVPGDIPYPIPVKVGRIDLVGPDRILAASAALEAFGGTCIVVDAGTATTIDLVTEEEGFLGGAILPGRRLMVEALHKGTDRLPLVDPEPVEDPLGTSTEGAIRAGAYLGWIGAVKEVVDRLQRMAGPCKLVLTGGDAGHLERAIGGAPEFMESLVLLGIRLSVEKWSRGRSG